MGQLLFFGFIAISMFYVSKFAYKLFKQKTERKAILKNGLINTFATISIIYFIFMMFWGLNYHRYKLDKILSYKTSEIKQEELIAVCKKLIKQTNHSKQELVAFKNMNNKELIIASIDGYAKLAVTNSKFVYKNSSVKSALAPKTMSYLGISGVYFPFTGEALVNTDVPYHVLPATICHEMAHQIGFAAEDEANFIAYLACKNNPSPIFQYSGYYMAMRYAMNSLRADNDSVYKTLELEISSEVRYDIAINKQYWQQFDTPISTISESINNIFLKANNQKAGVNSYGLMTRYLVEEDRN